MKPIKKQPAFEPTDFSSEQAHRVEQAAMELENAAVHVLEVVAAPTDDPSYVEELRELKNVATPVSLALSEFEGTQRFHYHYRHHPDNEEELYPVAGPEPLANLVHVSQKALKACEAMLGLAHVPSSAGRDRLVKGLHQFLSTVDSIIDKN